jgi:glutamyl-tRNA(Gln) amidotransferase subunit D
MIRPGDRVLVKTQDEELEGVLMQRPEIVPGNALILKLDSGYNVGIAKGKIKSIKLIRASEKPVAMKRFRQERKDLPKVVILSTGGTIASKVDYRSGAVYPAVTADDFVTNVPEILEYANIEARQIMQKWSEDLTPKDWAKIAKEVHKEIRAGAHGVIVTHGTDTMHYTSSAISFMVQNLPVPVIFVGSQRSVDRGSSDAYPNLLSAVIAAAKWGGAECVVCMHNSINDDINILVRGIKVRKMHTERRDAFRPINDLPLAKIDYHGNIARNMEHRERSKTKPILNTKLDEKVAIVYFHPGMSPQIIENLIKQRYHGIVIAGTGLGRVNRNLIPVLKKCRKAKIPVVMTSQALYGRVNVEAYEAGRLLVKETDVIYGEDLTPESAYIKLMFVLGQTRNLEKVKDMMTTNMVGEITKTTSPLSFLV